ncbi:MAG: RNA polymerase sigma factor [Planctomycetota bacterium]|jgi:RNA polymerase sigma factor (sigma-70 family)
MDELKSLVDRARRGDLDAYGLIVGRLQDMAFGYAYSLIGDFHLAEDATQEAFIAAYCRLDTLREPAAFAGWLRRIVFTRCDRLTRSRKLATVPWDAAGHDVAAEGAPDEAAEKREMRQAVLRAIRSLPDHERTATTLYYINGYSQNDIARFLEVPVTTVRGRLHSARRRLKGRMMAMVKETLESRRPGDAAREAVINELKARVAQFDTEVVKTWTPSRQWADGWHQRRLADVRANAAQYDMEPDLDMPRMLPEYQASQTFRDDFTDLPRRWGIPADTGLITLRELCRAVEVRPLALIRWQAEGMPVLKYRPWILCDEDRAGAWIESRDVGPDERMSADQARQPVRITLDALAEGGATVAEARAVVAGFQTATFRPMRGPGDVDRIDRMGLDPLWVDEWLSRREAERRANAALYGLDSPADSFLGVPPEFIMGDRCRVWEIRDLSRRLQISPFDIMRWTNDGMPALRYSPWMRWDLELTAAWVADTAALPDDRYTPKQLDSLDEFVLTAVATGRQPPDLAHQILQGWSGLA